MTRGARYRKTPLGRLVYDRRREMGLTQEEVSVRVGMSQEWTSMLERGRIKQPRVSALQRLAKVLELPTEQVILASGMASTRGAAQALTPEDIDHPDLVLLVERMRRLSPEALRYLVPIVDGMVLASEEARAERDEEYEREDVEMSDIVRSW